MIEEILPATAIAVEARKDSVDVVLFAQEQRALGRAVEKRRREFTTARACARDALAGLGLPPMPIPSGVRGEPQWPAGIVGSITHCEGYRACAVARTTDLLTIGIDAEPHEALPEGVLAAVARVEELSRLRELARVVPQVHWDRLLFSAKESVYKAWFPLVKRALGFEDASLTFHSPQETCSEDSREGAFSASLLVPGSSSAGVPLRELSGRWLLSDGLLLTAIAPALIDNAPLAAGNLD